VSWNKDTGRQVFSLLLDLRNTQVNLINIYAPTNLTKRKVFFEKLQEFFIPADGVISAVISIVMNTSLINSEEISQV